MYTRHMETKHVLVVFFSSFLFRHTGASTTSRKSQGTSVLKSKYGKVGGTTYNSSRTNIPLSASKTRTDKQTEKPHRAPVQVRYKNSESHTENLLRNSIHSYR